MEQQTIGQAEKAFFEKEGYLVLKRFFSEEAVSALNEAYHKVWMELMADGKIVQAANRPFDSLYPRLRDYHRGNEIITRFILDDRAMDALEALTGEEMLACQTSYYFKAPGAKGLPLHQDNYSIGAYPDTTYAIWVSLDVSDERNGGLRVVPGSHVFDIVSPESVHEKVNVYGKRIQVPEGFEQKELANDIGDVVIFNGNLLHGSSDNHSRDSFRRVIVTHYARASVEKITLNYSYLLNRKGEKVRRKLNPAARVVETKESLFEFKEAKFFDQIIHRG
ncbi:phytanoyl-CoA dioxygenase family protein [Paenibacillus elgii]|uniref:phytanoyl-CoA dioxygenase family protein n=1 Tax=Paenibacillus elgii TaxID=189691 RepID=UPI00203F882B|nr:phytanoyl-CoA dioxygenase family protein [Paenibacillus elgii]MCM3272189.1 phytanoyl-CoA dioxygenase family protein [Paenibacillus elgii]